MGNDIKMKRNVDVVYVMASKLGSIGMGSIGYNSIKLIDEKKVLTYNLFCRGYNHGLKLDKNNVKSYGYLEFFSLPLRFLQKKFGLKFNPFVFVNNIFGKGVAKNLPKCKIYHTWMGIALEAIIRAKKQGSILILEGGNSHPLNMLDILNEEFRLLKKDDLIIEPAELDEQIKALKLFDYVLCPSDFVYSSFIKYEFPKEKLIKTSYGVDVNRFTVQRKKDKIFRAVFVGSLQVRKGIHYLLKAWDELKLRDAELIIVGRVWPDSRDIVEKYKKNKSIKFVGFDANPGTYLRKSDVFVFPSIEEGSALVTYEAMASGLPIITTFNSGSVARNGKEGFIVPIRDVKALKQKIRYLYNNPKICRKMGLAARKRIEKYSWDKYSERLIEIYKKLMSSVEP